jgi:hypothetical protein
MPWAIDLAFGFEICHVPLVEFLTFVDVGLLSSCNSFITVIKLIFSFSRSVIIIFSV